MQFSVFSIFFIFSYFILQYSRWRFCNGSVFLKIFFNIALLIFTVFSMTVLQCEGRIYFIRKKNFFFNKIPILPLRFCNGWRFCNATNTLFVFICCSKSFMSVWKVSLWNLYNERLCLFLNLDNQYRDVLNPSKLFYSPCFSAFWIRRP